MEKKAKIGFPPILFAGCVFGFIGIIYLLVSTGLLSASTDADSQLSGKIFLLLGLLMTVLSLVLMLVALKKKRKAQYLLEEGHFVWGTVSELTDNKRIDLFGRHPYRAVITYTDPIGVRHTFYSRDIYRKLQVSLVGKKVRVYTSQEGDTSYYADIESLLPQDQTI